MTQRAPKKSESLEIRLSHPDKEAFMARCRAEGRSASDALRGFIAGQVARPARPPRLRYWIVGGLAAAALGAVAAPSLAGTGADRQFDAMDADGDRAVSLAEFARLDADRDGRLTLAEFRAAGGRTGRNAD